MTDQQNESLEVLPGEQLTTVSAEPLEPLESVGTPLADAPVHVRVGGQAGVRVTQAGQLTVKRVTGLQESDSKQVPTAVLGAVRELLEVHGAGDDGPSLTAAERLLAVRDLLTPWL